MFSDSHAHIFMVLKRSGNGSFLKEIMDKKYRFLMDIGTEPGDLHKRRTGITEVLNGNIPGFIHFAAGLWPEAASIAEPEKSLAALRADLDILLSEGAAYCALGECGLDRHWNGAAAAEALARGESAGTTDIEGEEFLFKAQLKLAQEKKLAVVVHSRSAFADTVKCMDQAGYHRGVIHCYSYGIEEAKSFLERGWYISFPGTITYAKKQADKDRIAALIRSVPQDRLLLETDSPYLAPRPFRGKLNTPLLIEYTYAAVSEILGVHMEELAETVYRNCVECFKVPAAE